MNPLDASPGATVAASVLLALLLGGIDWVTGYELNFFVFYFIPIALAAWRATPVGAVCTALLCAVVWAAADQAAGATYSRHLFATWNTVIRLASFLVVAWAVHRVGQALSGERTARAQLERTLSELRVLRGLLSICAECKKIRNEDGDWQPVEAYVVQHSEAMFSHGYCPTCAQRALVEAGLSLDELRRK